MTIKKISNKPVTLTHEIDEIHIVTYYGSQSTEYTVKLFSRKKLIKEKDVNGIDAGIEYLSKAVSNPKNNVYDVDQD